MEEGKGKMEKCSARSNQAEAAALFHFPSSLFHASPKEE
jgi:hypothetical protein